MGVETGKWPIIRKMRRYLADRPDPINTVSVDLVTARSYEITTVKELITRVKSSDDPPEMVVSEFIKMADKQSGMVFRVAYETAVDLYDHVFL